MIKSKQKQVKEKGQIFVVVLAAMGVVLFTVLSVIAGAQIYYQNSSYSIDAQKATALAEAGIDKAVSSLNKTGGSYNGESETSLGDGSYSVSITSLNAATKVITATGYLPNKTNPRAKRTVKIQASKGVGVSFVYGVQIGEGGLHLGNNNTVEGTVYSNGDISMGDNNVITGDAWVAGGPQASADQSTDCTGVNCTDFIFGKDSSGALDVGMSFKPSCTNPPTCAVVLNKVTVKVKKIGNPPDETVRILADSNGIPDKNNILATGTLYSSLVTADYGWIDVTFTSSPTLSADTPYWIMIDTSANSTNYWSWQSDLAKSYNNGQALWSSNWNTKNPSWNNLIPDGDLSFKTTMGGGITSISGDNNDTVSGSVHANTINQLTVNQDAYYQTLTQTTVKGIKHPNSDDPPPKVFPISDANIADWQNQASQNDLSAPVCGSVWGPGKYTGDVTLGSNCTVTVKSPIWIAGNLTLNNSNTLKLDQSYGSTSGVIVTGGVITLGNNNTFAGTGIDSSILMALSTYDSNSNGGASAIIIGNNGNTGVFYASKGILEPGNNNNFKELTAWEIKLTNNTTINYQTGLASTLFSSGPSGTFSLVKGTYQIN